MEYLLLWPLLLLTLYTFSLVIRPNSKTRKKLKLPPGPTSLPIIGNILQLGRNPHRSLAKLSKTYGPLMHLKLGSIHTIVASSPEMAREILQRHDQACSGRAVPHVMHAAGHNEVSLGWLPTGRKWREMRKISREHMLTPQKLKASEHLRQEKLRQLRDYIEESCREKRLVNLEEVSFATVLNLVSTTLFSVDFASFDSNSSLHEIKELLQGILNIAGTPNIADYFPVFRSVGPQGLKRKAEIYFVNLLEKFDEIINKRLEERGEGLRRKDMLEILLDLNQEDDANLTLHTIKHLLIDIFVAATDTTTETMQWLMDELIRNPSKLSKAKQELTRVIGQNGVVQESDISKLPYLTAIVKESLRLHPPGPLLIPHQAKSDVEINGYTIPRGAQILVNMWAIATDPTIWPDPDSFQPERFMGSNIEYKGQDFEYIPFGSGRRSCPGLPLAHIMLHLMVASMIHKFDWKAEDDHVDMDEVFSLSLQKATPLKALPFIKC